MVAPTVQQHTIAVIDAIEHGTGERHVREGRAGDKVGKGMSLVSLGGSDASGGGGTIGGGGTAEQSSAKEKEKRVDLDAIQGHLCDVWAQIDDLFSAAVVVVVTEKIPCVSC